jgi:LuxR family maltose regulon positive regulatory protein
MRAAVLAELDPETVAALTEREDAGAVLAKLYEERLFIERRLVPSGASYQFHPLFHNFLRSRLARCRSSADIAGMRSRAAVSLEKRGLLESATALGLECDDSDVLVRLILAQAPQMAARGRLTTLQNWVHAVPEPILVSNGWLLYWLGISSSLRDMTLGRASLERAYVQFLQTGDSVGVWITVASIIQNHFMGWGSAPNEAWQWVDTFECMRARNGASIPNDIEIQILNILCYFASHCPEHTLSRHLVERALILIPHISDIEQRMTIAGAAVGFLVWRGDEAAAWVLLEQLAADRDSDSRGTVSALTFDVWRGTLLWTRSEHERCFAEMTEARKRYRRAGLGFLECLLTAQFACGALSAGDWALADRLLQEGAASLQPFQVVVGQLLNALRAMQLSLRGQTMAGAALARKIIAADTLIMSPSTASMERSCLVAACSRRGRSRRRPTARSRLWRRRGSCRATGGFSMRICFLPGSSWSDGMSGRRSIIFGRRLHWPRHATFAAAQACFNRSEPPGCSHSRCAMASRRSTSRA